LATATAVDPAPPRSRQRPSLLARLTQPTVSAVIGVAFVAWGVWLGVRPLSDNSFFTHLATGRLILDTHGVPTADPYSFTAAGQPWVVQSWLASLLYGLTESWWGATGLRVLAGVLTGTVAGLTWRLTRPAGTLIPRVGVTALVMAIGSVMWSPRPLLIGMVALGLTMLAAEDGLDPRWLVPVFWIWVNSHGSFPLGLVALALLAWGRKLDGQDPRVEWRALKWAALGTVLGAINPLGPKVLLFPIELLGKSDVLQNISEWQSPQFTAVWSRLFLVLVAIAVLALVRRPSWRAALPIVVFLAAALLGARNITVCTLVLAPLVAGCLAGLGSVTGKDRSPVFGVVLVVVLVGGTFAVVSNLSQPAYDLSTYPVAAVAWLDQHGAIGTADARVATNDTTGNYLELLYGTQAHAFMDDRVDMYPKPVVDDLVTLLHGQPGWDQVLDDRHVDVVLWDKAQPLPELLERSPNWRVAYEDGQSVVACRRGTTTGSLHC
jgi:hypothetical protein